MNEAHRGLCCYCCLLACGVAVMVSSAERECAHSLIGTYMGFTEASGVPSQCTYP